MQKRELIRILNITYNDLKLSGGSLWVFIFTGFPMCVQLLFPGKGRRLYYVNDVGHLLECLGRNMQGFYDLNMFFLCMKSIHAKGKSCIL